MTNQATDSNTESGKVVNASMKKLVALHLTFEGMGTVGWKRGINDAFCHLHFKPQRLKLDEDRQVDAVLDFLCNDGNGFSSGQSYVRVGSWRLLRCPEMFAREA